jgi:hypothetical protein
MTKNFLRKRPECERILNQHYLWTINEEELQINKELMTFIESKASDEKFTVYTILESKLRLYIMRKVFPFPFE